MGIRLKVLLAFVLCFGLMAGVSLFLLQQSMSKSYEAIERDDIADNMGRVEQSFEASATSLKNVAKDWAVWNDMYRYALKPDARWAKDNIGPESLAPADIAFSAVFGKDGRLLTYSAIQIEGAYLNIFTPQNSAYFLHIKANTQQAQCGLIKTDAGLMQICWAGIVHTDALNDVVGTVLLGRLLDATRIQKLREQTKLSFDLKAQAGLPTGLTAWRNILKPGTIGSGAFWTSLDDEVVNIFYPVRDILQGELGLISLDMPRTVHRQGVQLFQQVRQQLLWTALLMTTLLGLTLNFMLVRRLRRFARQLEVLEGSSSWATRIDIGGHDELSLVAANFNKLLSLIQSQVESLKELLAAKESALQVIESTQAQLKQSEQAALQGQQRVSDLLNHSGQGFLSFGADLVIDLETSRACDSMLGCSPAGRNAAQVLAGQDSAQAELFGEVIAAALAESEPVVRESMLSLLPSELARGDRLLKADYKLLGNGKTMVVLTDITEEQRLQTMLQNERSRQAFIVSVVSDSRSFFDALDAWREFVEHQLPRLLQTTLTEQSTARKLYRDIHTYKGLLNQFGFIHTPTALHALETRLSALVAQGDALLPQQLAEAVSLHDLKTPFEQDLAILRDALGQEFLAHRKSIRLTDHQAQQLEAMAAHLLAGESIDASRADMHTLLNALLHLRKLSLNALLSGFDSLVKQVATRLGKEVAPLKVEGGDDIWIDPQPYQAFLQALGHVFRNAVTHGLGTPEERWAEGKNEPGQIMCRISQSPSSLHLSISDDGVGIDLEAIRQRAVAAGLYTAEAVQQVSDDDIAKLIFRDHISSTTTVTEDAGRGVGLAAVWGETQKLGGTLAVKTLAGKGTEFLFTLPWPGAASQAGSHASQAPCPATLIMQSMVTQTCDYFSNEHGIHLADVPLADNAVAAPRLLDVSVMIGFGGQIQRQAIFSFENNLVNAVHAWMTEGLAHPVEELTLHREAAIGELVNTILGHCTIDMAHLDHQGITMTPPLILDPTATFPGPGHTVLDTHHLVSQCGRLSISLVAPR